MDTVSPDRGLDEFELAGELGVAEPLGEQLQHPGLAGGEGRAHALGLHDQHPRARRGGSHLLDHRGEDLPFRARWFPLGPLGALLMCAVVIVGQSYEVLGGHTDLRAVLSSYLGLPLFLALCAGHELVTRSRSVDLGTADLSRG